MNVCKTEIRILCSWKNCLWSGFIHDCFLWLKGSAQMFWMSQCDFAKGLIDTAESLSFKSKIVWVFESRSRIFNDYCCTEHADLGHQGLICCHSGVALGSGNAFESQPTELLSSRLKALLCPVLPALLNQ